MSAELEQYNYELARLEDLNTRLRLRLNDSDTKLGNVMHNASVMGSRNSSLSSMKPTMRGSGTAGTVMLPPRSLRDSSSSHSSSSSTNKHSKGELSHTKSKATDTSKLPAIKLSDKSSLRLRKRQQKGRAMTLEDVTAIIARAIFVIN